MAKRRTDNTMATYSLFVLAKTTNQNAASNKYNVSIGQFGVSVIQLVHECFMILRPEP